MGQPQDQEVTVWARQLRRVVTGLDGEGKSVVVSDGPAPELMTFHEMWSTAKMPSDLSFPPDIPEGGLRLEPPANGTVFHLVQLEPEDPSMPKEELERILSQAYAQLSAAHCRPNTTRDPRMHRTQSIDYIILLEGELTLLLDNGEVDLKPFDVVIQRGTNHAWINKGPGPALIAAVMIDCEAPPE